MYPSDLRFPHRLHGRPGRTFSPTVFYISDEAHSISGATENAGKVPETQVPGIQLASVQRQRVVSNHLFCIFIISQCEEVLATPWGKRKKERRRKEKKNRKFPWDISCQTKLEGHHTSPRRPLSAFGGCPPVSDSLLSLTAHPCPGVNGAGCRRNTLHSAIKAAS